MSKKKIVLHIESLDDRILPGTLLIISQPASEARTPPPIRTPIPASEARTPPPIR